MPLYDNDAPFTAAELLVLTEAMGYYVHEADNDDESRARENLLAKVATHYIMPLYDNDAPFTAAELLVLTEAMGYYVHEADNDDESRARENLLAKVATHYIRAKAENERIRRALTPSENDEAPAPKGGQ